MSNRNGLAAAIDRRTEPGTTESNRLAQVAGMIAELQARMPKHSVPPAMIVELEELEEELEELKREASDGRGQDIRV